MTTFPTTSTELTALVTDLRAQREQEQTALRAQLIGAGHTPAQVDLAMAQAYGYQEAAIAAPAPVAMSCRALTLTIIANVLLKVLMSLTFFGIIGGSGMILFVIQALAGYGLLKGGRPAVGKGILWGAAISFGLVVVLGSLLPYVFFFFAYGLGF